MKDSHNVCTYCKWNGMLVATSEWAAGAQVYLYKRWKLCIDRLKAEGGTNFAIAWWLPLASSLGWLKYSHCMTSQPVFRLSLQLTRVLLRLDNCLHCMVPPYDKLFSANVTSSSLLQTGQTLICATAFVQWLDIWPLATVQFIACSRSPLNVLHLPSNVWICNPYLSWLSVKMKWLHFRGRVLEFSWAEKIKFCDAHFSRVVCLHLDNFFTICSVECPEEHENIDHSDHSPEECIAPVNDVLAATFSHVRLHTCVYNVKHANSIIHEFLQPHEDHFGHMLARKEREHNAADHRFEPVNVRKTRPKRKHAHQRHQARKKRDRASHPSTHPQQFEEQLAPVKEGEELQTITHEAQGYGEHHNIQAPILLESKETDV